MRLALLLTASACLAVSSPAHAGAIGKAVGNIAGMVGQTAGAAICATEPGRQAVLQGLGLTSLSPLGGFMANGHRLTATVVNPQKMGAGFQQGDQVEITVTDASACRFSVAPAASNAKGLASGAKGPSSHGSPRASAMAAARSGLPGAVGGQAELPYIEFEVDAQGRPVRR